MPRGLHTRLARCGYSDANSELKKSRPVTPSVCLALRQRRGVLELDGKHSVGGARLAQALSSEACPCREARKGEGRRRRRSACEGHRGRKHVAGIVAEATETGTLAEMHSHSLRKACVARGAKQRTCNEPRAFRQCNSCDVAQRHERSHAHEQRCTEALL